ncbi:hypothetical protein M408DRAFT_327257 [Serendipita vermifera MAFF 305830]|uniref:Uncharacterized protein n=1 Tax=Serendipita vermifera MAFF 305830 TaxID=933852 RepID=A0A0C3BK24_SERVB|nr:hypothetical protein M408DRAFT_327257 [Serendipita vermifera MAFF 305830]
MKKGVCVITVFSLLLSPNQSQVLCLDLISTRSPLPYRPLFPLSPNLPYPFFTILSIPSLPYSTYSLPPLISL